MFPYLGKCKKLSPIQQNSKRFRKYSKFRIEIYQQLLQVIECFQYYVDYWFTVNGTKASYADSFMSAIGIVAQVPNLIVAIINVMNLIRGPLIYRVLAPLAFNSLLIVVILVLVIVQQPSDDGEWVLWFC